MKSLITLIFFGSQLLIAQTADTVYMPLNLNNRWQYLNTISSFDGNSYSLNQTAVQGDTLIGDTVYYKMGDLFFYSVPEKKLYIYVNDTPHVYVDFTVPNGSIYSAYRNGHYVNIQSRSGVRNIFGIQRPYGGYLYLGVGWGVSEEFSDSLGITSRSSSGGPGSSNNKLIAALICDSAGTRCYTEGYKPTFQITPLTIINSNVFDLSFLIGHHYTFLPAPGAPPWLGGLDFISDVKMKCYYSNGDSIIQLPDITPVHSPSPVNLNYRVTTSLDTVLLKNGYSFYYKFTATDKCMVPGISNSPDTGYYECKWEFAPPYFQSFIEPGNRWDYVEGWWNGLGGGESDSNSYYATADTILQNGKTYNKILPENELFQNYLRADTSGVWYYDYDCNDEWLYFAYNDSVGQERLAAGNGCDTLQFPVSITKTEDSSIVLFGETLRIMSFQVLVAIDVWYSVTISPELGFVNWYSSSLNDNYYKLLIGCVISGTVHGTLLTGAEDDHQKLNFMLEQNYPNPFNPSTKIKYSVPERSKIVIKIFDILGNEIALLANEEKPAGQYEVNWNAAGLPSGVYFYQLHAGDYIETRKMVLMR